MSVRREEGLAQLKLLHTVIVKAVGHMPLTVDEMAFASKYAADLYNMIKAVDK